MRFYTFGNISNPKLLLIHGMFTPWQIWNSQIDFFSLNYYVIVPALDAHDKEYSEFICIEDEAKKIEDYFCYNFKEQSLIICGVSMGGAIAYHISNNHKLKITHLVLDSAPLVPLGCLLEKILTINYLNILHKSKSRNKKTLDNFKKHFLPEKYLKDYLVFIDTMSDFSVINMVKSISKNSFILDNLQDTHILYIHGSSFNELLSKKSAKLIKTHYPNSKIVSFKGSHGHKLIYDSNDWNYIVNNFLKTHSLFL